MPIAPKRYLVKTGIGVSQKNDLVEAAREAAQKAKQEMKGKKPGLLMFYCVYTYQGDYEKALKVIRDEFGDETIPLVGGQVLGFFAKDKYYFDIEALSKIAAKITKPLGKIIKPLRFSGLCVIALQSPFLQFGTGIGFETNKEPVKAGKNCVEMALKNLPYSTMTAYMGLMRKGPQEIRKIRPLNGIILTPGGFGSRDGFFRGYLDNQILEGITSYSKEWVKFTGGGLGGKFVLVEKGGVIEDPYIFFNNKVYQNAVISIVFSSDLEVGYGTDTGAEFVTSIGVVTKTQGWEIEEINQKPALDVFAEIFEKHTGAKKEELLTDFMNVLYKRGYYLGLSEPNTDFFWPLSISQILNKKLLTLGPVKVGTGLSLVKISKESAQTAARDAAKMMQESAKEEFFHFVMFFSCAARGWVLGPKYMKEMQIIKNILGQKDIPIFGICSSGEIAFFKTGLARGSNATINMLGVSDRFLMARYPEEE
ncbi:FIST C-terminal domain-containing protein [Candidatus Parcubacteria bacterium]|nr:FIST C-terminal domain-containing protein [Candidatus Parcubacteria bacterium]